MEIKGSHFQLPVMRQASGSRSRHTLNNRERVNRSIVELISETLLALHFAWNLIELGYEEA